LDTAPPTAKGRIGPLCKAWAEQSPRPSERHVRAILFPESTQKPELVWVLTELESVDEDEDYSSIDIRPFVGSSRSGMLHVGHDMIALGELPKIRLIELQVRDAFLFDGSGSTQSLFHSMAPLGEFQYDWRGPILACRHPGLDGPYQGADLSDFRLVLGYLLWYNNPVRSFVPGVHRNDEFYGVCICGRGETRLGFPKFSSVLVHRSIIPMITGDRASGVSSISCRVGPDLRITKLRAAPAAEGDTQNQEATMMMMEADPDSKPDPGSGVGTVLITREDKENLEVPYVVALAYCCKYDLVRLFDEECEARKKKANKHEAIMRKAKLLEAMTPQGFEKGRNDARVAREAMYGM
ncbi:hypothetical protein HK405_010325, partial [Cladochytrium tenue]